MSIIDQSPVSLNEDLNLGRGIYSRRVRQQNPKEFQ